jgi:hypothetical protein
VPAALEQLVELLEAIQAPDQQLRRLLAATGPLLCGGQLSAEQLAAFRVQYSALQTRVRRQCVEEAGAAVDVLLRVLGV